MFVILRLLVIEEISHNCEPTAQTKCNDETDQSIDNNILLVGLSGLTVVLRAAVLAFDMREHGRSERAAPPGVADFFGVALSAGWAGGVLGRVLHEISSEKM